MKISEATNAQIIHFWKSNFTKQVLSKEKLKLLKEVYKEYKKRFGRELPEKNRLDKIKEEK